MEFRGLATIVVSADNTLLQFLFSETIGAISDISGSRRVASGQWRVGEVRSTEKRQTEFLYFHTVWAGKKQEDKKTMGRAGNRTRDLPHPERKSYL